MEFNRRADAHFNCVARNNAQHGINSTSGNNRNYIEGCLLHGNTGFGIFLQAGGNTVIKNQVGGNTGGTINMTGSNIAPIQRRRTAAAVCIRWRIFRDAKVHAMGNS